MSRRGRGGTYLGSQNLVSTFAKLSYNTGSGQSVKWRGEIHFGSNKLFIQKFEGGYGWEWWLGVGAGVGIRFMDGWVRRVNKHQYVR